MYQYGVACRLHTQGAVTHGWSFLSQLPAPSSQVELASLLIAPPKVKVPLFEEKIRTDHRTMGLGASKNVEETSDRVLVAGRPDLSKCDNMITTAKYTVWTFLPLVRIPSCTLPTEVLL